MKPDSLLPVKTPTGSFLAERGPRLFPRGGISSRFLLGSSCSDQSVATESKIPGNEDLSCGSGGKKQVTSAVSSVLGLLCFHIP